MQFLTQEILKKESKSNQNWKRGSASKRTKRHSWSANRHMGNPDPDSRNPQKRVQIEPKLEKGLGIQEGQTALLELALAKCQLAQI